MLGISFIDQSSNGRYVFYFCIPNKTYQGVIGTSFGQTPNNPVESQPNSTQPISAGYVYIFCNQALWREIRINDQGDYSEVDLATFAGLDIRNAEGLPERVCMLPHRVNGDTFVLEVAFSESQWSWQRIEYFGGVDKEDIRLVAFDLAICGCL